MVVGLVIVDGVGDVGVVGNVVVGVIGDVGVVGDNDVGVAGERVIVEVVGDDGTSVEVVAMTVVVVVLGFFNEVNLLIKSCEITRPLATSSWRGFLACTRCLLNN